MRLVVATGDYAHTRLLANPVSPSDEFEIDWRPGRPESIFARALSDEAPFDVAEMSLATTWALASANDTRFYAIPVFPSRMYRLSAFYVRPGIERPAQLAGGRIGVVRYGQTAAVWGRALLAEHHGIEISKIHWWVAERQSFEPQGIKLHQADGAGALEKMLAGGELDCLFATSVPEIYRQDRALRLFPDWPQEERALFETSGFLPIMHTVMVRTSLVKARPDLAAALVRRFDSARKAALDWLGDTDASVLPLPLHHGWMDTTTCGGTLDPFVNGLEPNRTVLEAFADHMHRQGLTVKRIAPDDVFRAEC